MSDILSCTIEIFNNGLTKGDVFMLVYFRFNLNLVAQSGATKTTQVIRRLPSLYAKLE